MGDQRTRAEWTAPTLEELEISETESGSYGKGDEAPAGANSKYISS